MNKIFYKYIFWEEQIIFSHNVCYPETYESGEMRNIQANPNPLIPTLLFLKKPELVTNPAFDSVVSRPASRGTKLIASSLEKKFSNFLSWSSSH